MSTGRPLPDRLPGPDGLVLRRWRPEDAEALAEAVRTSAEHLRPWMPWVAHEPLSVAERAKLIRSWERDRRRGGDVVLGIFLGGQVAGGCGLHRRLGPGGLEIGYWTHAGFVRRGLATLASALLTDAAFARPEINRVQIRHDKANARSGAVPRRLGFTLLEEVPDEVQAPGEIGISCQWQITRDQWLERAPLATRLAIKA
ncbi:MAG TPA: GNAT family N-acetyltransferase [Solirubrobacteraceae bacterium]|nr:GNAT family N-acetyltransferase [Solirubrobacteraceae bacterium]